MCNFKRTKNTERYLCAQHILKNTHTHTWLINIFGNFKHRYIKIYQLLIKTLPIKLHTIFFSLIQEKNLGVKKTIHKNRLFAKTL